jgi:hypothetical protein
VAELTEQTDAEGPMLAMNFRELILPNDCCEQYVIAGAMCLLSTNSEAIHRAMEETFGRPTDRVPTPDITMRVVVDDASRPTRPWPKPYFRGLSHLVFARFDSESELVVDLRSRRIIGRISPPMAADQVYLRRVVFPAVFGIVSETIRLTPLHCACVASNTSALLLAGDSGSGKSTLSVALAQSGLAFISDDWTYLSRRGDQVLAWSLNSHLKLLPDAVEHFPELARFHPIISQNGELAYELEPDRLFGIRRCLSAEPRCLIFLQRQEGQEFNQTEMSSDEAAARIEQNWEELPATIWGARDFLLETIRILVRVPCWQVRYGAETPQEIARRILRHLNDQKHAYLTGMQKVHAS